MKTHRHALDPMMFNYAIQYPSGEFYTGRVTSEEKPNYHAGDKGEAFAYTLEGAYRRIENSWHFEGCKVVRIS